MTPEPVCRADPLYASGSLLDGAGEPLRPGGAQLTAHAVECGRWRPGERVIDIGCGCGTSLAYLRRRGLNAIGVDISPHALRLAKHRAGESLVVQASGDALPFPDGGADGVLAECSLSLMPSAARAMAEFHRVLRPGGRLVVTDVYARNPAVLKEDAAGLPGCLSGLLEKEDTIRRLESAGFGLDAWEDHSDVLKAFVTRFIFEHGSLAALWGGASSETARRLRPGYVLLVARKSLEPQPRSVDAAGRSAHG
ncbi:DVU_1556 family methyltransferase [Telmatospirillum siberiense]|uniref:SAM-dependent methyltransferase n=1 Tax=Telmatospirillum siberiense TaxID=382514 RepID=A0A2N3PWX2_9PROT|nr:class I SAM-dependent methyltransferase [Telmatospirillum siberiense]PKU24914.1 SAM-dependent methyltransferase [Telmatospirillum siberiense]